MSARELKPCPFCGGRAERFTIVDDDEVANIGGDVITCQQCNASSQVQFGEKATLAEAWNRRTDLPPGYVILSPDEVRGIRDEALEEAAKEVEDERLTKERDEAERLKINWPEAHIAHREANQALGKANGELLKRAFDAERRAEALSRTGAVKVGYANYTAPDNPFVTPAPEGQQPVAKAVELSGNAGELIEKMAEAIRGDTTSDDTPWAALSEDRKTGWRGDAERALAVVKEYLTARRPSEQAVTEAMKAAADQLEKIAFNIPAPNPHTPQLVTLAIGMRDFVLKAAMEAGR